MHICTRNEPNINECIKHSIEVLRPFLVRGIPEIDIPSIDPIDIGDLLVAEHTRSNGIQITAKDIKSYGASSFVIKNLQWVFLREKIYFYLLIDSLWPWNKIQFYRVVEYGGRYDVEVFFPKMEVEGTYDVSGQVILLPIKGNGKFVGNFSKFWFFSFII